MWVYCMMSLYLFPLIICDLLMFTTSNQPFKRKILKLPSLIIPPIIWSQAFYDRPIAVRCAHEEFLRYCKISGVGNIFIGQCFSNNRFHGHTKQPGLCERYPPMSQMGQILPTTFISNHYIDKSTEPHTLTKQEASATDKGGKLSKSVNLDMDFMDKGDGSDGEYRKM